MNETDIFQAPWDGRLLATTTIVSAVLLLAGGAVLWLALGRMPPGGVRWLMVASAAIPLAGFVLCALLGPRGYAITGDRLIVRRPLAPVGIPIASIRAVGDLPVASLAGSIRTGAAGGVFGYYGSFRNQALGSYRMYATRGSGHVLVRADRPYVLTPDDPGRFIETLNRARAAAGGPAAQAPR